MSKEALGTTQRTCNTQNTKSIHRSTPQREERQITARVVHPTAKHTTRYLCPVLCPMSAHFHVVHTQRTRRHDDVVQLGRTVARNKGSSNRKQLPTPNRQTMLRWTLSASQTSFENWVPSVYKFLKFLCRTSGTSDEIMSLYNRLVVLIASFS